MQHGWKTLLSSHLCDATLWDEARGNCSLGIRVSRYCAGLSDFGLLP